MNRTSKTSSTIVVPRRDLCIDFANTRYWRGSEPVETVHNFSEMVRWCETNAMLGREAAERALRCSEKHGRDAAAIFDDAIALRETIYLVCFAMTDGKTAEARDVAAINAALDGAPERRVLAHREKTFGWRIDRAARSAAGLLAPVLWSAGDLIVSPEVGRLRHCLNDQCGWLFMDDSKNGSRRWCSMRSCGNRAKAQRHYLRSKQNSHVRAH
jgi:predicted RNA-binding Zn ribbon-like protein